MSVPVPDVAAAPADADALATGVGVADGVAEGLAVAAEVGAAVVDAPWQTPGYEDRPGTFELVPGMPQAAWLALAPYCSTTL